MHRSGACTPTMYSVSWVFALPHTWGLSSHLGNLYSIQMGLNMSSCPYNEFESPWTRMDRMWCRDVNGLDTYVRISTQKGSFKLTPFPCDRFNIIFIARKPCWDVEQRLDHRIHDSTVLWYELDSEKQYDFQGRTAWVICNFFKTVPELDQKIFNSIYSASRKQTIEKWLQQATGWF